MEIIEQKISWVVLVRHNQIPLQALANQKNMNVFVAKYGFVSGDRIQDSASQLIKAIAFSTGLFRSNEIDHVVERITIEERRMVFTIVGTSYDASLFYEEIKHYLLDLQTNKDPSMLEQILVSQESEILFKAKYHSNRLISPKMGSLVKKVTASSTSEYAKASIGCITTNFAIEFMPSDEVLSQYRISLSRKVFTLGNAIGYPLSEQVYASKAPLPSDVHAVLLESFEEQF